MIIAVFFITLSLFITLCLLFVYAAYTNSSLKDNLHTIKNGFKAAVKDSGFNVNSNETSIELYQWTIVKSGEVCDECLDRTEWPAMDLAEWMHEDLTLLPEEMTRCQGDCRCDLKAKRVKKYN